MTINRSNISTSADGADIFTVTGANSPFTNYGNLTTSGDLASPIHAAAAGVTVVNRGTLTTAGDGSTGITAFDPVDFFVNNVTIRNYGTINSTAIGENLTFADGIDVFGNQNTVANYGAINIADPDASAIYSVGSGSSIVNYGTLNESGNAIYVDSDGTETGDSVVNYGQMHTTVDESRAIWIFAADSTVKNFGTIQADGFHSFGISMEGNADHGENYGTILATGEQGRGVLFLGENLSFLNKGVIQTPGEDSVGIRFAGENLPDTDGGTFTNYGKVQSAGWAVRGSDSNDHVINHGSMTGEVDLGAGDDSFVAGKGGSLSGALTLGDGNDLIVFEKGGGSLTVTDFVAGAGTDDVIDLGAFGYASFAEVMTHASQSGTDVILKLGAKDQIVLDNVSLGSLAADDFSLVSSFLGQSPALTYVPHGDHLFA